jgi:MFS superfamily sulfate permease-like transporter
MLLSSLELGQSAGRKKVQQNKQNSQADALAGATVAIMAVPQSVSFAAMAGLPAAYGLYTGTLTSKRIL